MIFPIKDLKIWCAELNIGIPVRGYGYSAYVDSYRIKYLINPEEDCWLIGEDLIPIETSKLVDQTGKEIEYTSFTIINDKIQINGYVGDGYTCKVYNINEIFIKGESFKLEE